jgi:hypothetical protein
MADTKTIIAELEEMSAKIQALHPDRGDLDEIPLHELLDLAEHLGDEHLALRMSMQLLTINLIEEGLY